MDGTRTRRAPDGEDPLARNIILKELGLPERHVPAADATLAWDQLPDEEPLTRRFHSLQDYEIFGVSAAPGARGGDGQKRPRTGLFMMKPGDSGAPKGATPNRSGTWPEVAVSSLLVRVRG